jgi:phenylalanyl-tRNA synthetase beta chain
MKAPLSWLKDFVEINISNKELADKLTLSGSKVESIEEPFGEIENVVVGKIIEIEKHPDADKLVVCQVDVGEQVLQIVTGAPNVKVGDVVPVALVGARLPGGVSISKSKLRGMHSFGMLCSLGELNLTKEDFPKADENGIFILDEQHPLGKNIKDVLDLHEVVFEFEITPNRPDCLSIKGLAREVAVTLNKPFKEKAYQVNETSENSSDLAKVEVLDPLCSRYVGKVVKNVQIKESPRWMKARLQAAGVRSINNIVDITNYVLLELGQPMHAFDLDRLKGKKVVVRRATNGETLVSLDEVERTLDDSMLIIADDKDPVAIAGVMGGEFSKVTEDTKTILFESANFEGSSIRNTAKKIALRTDSSARFEKGLPPENAMLAIEMAVSLIESLTAGEVCGGVIDVYHQNAELEKIPFHPEKINAFLGTNLDQEYMLGVFNALEFHYDEKTGMLSPPFFRRDVKIEADLAEEIARFYDYNNIEPTLLSGKESMQGKRSFKQKVALNTRRTMLSCGYSEMYTYSFMSPKSFDKLRVKEELHQQEAVVIQNPLGEDFSLMRTTTLPSILTSLGVNYSRRNSSAKLFEIALVYLKKDDEELPEEKSVLTMGMYGEGDFYQIKGDMEELFHVLGIKEYAFLPEKANSSFHQGRTARVFIKQEEVGIVGQIHPEVSEEFSCGDETYVGVLYMDGLFEHVKWVSKYKPLPKFPMVQRDIAMILKEDILVKEIEDCIVKEAKEILEDLELFDIYKGKQVPEGMKSVAYSLTFRASDRTLTDEEVQKTMGDILKALEENFGAKLR